MCDVKVMYAATDGGKGRNEMMTPVCQSFAFVLEREEVRDFVFCTSIL
jgi:hypothetical protein